MVDRPAMESSVASVEAAFDGKISTPSVAQESSQQPVAR
jgi:hypothetical protein